MICIILAAGYATRLYPLTENFPKPLLKIKEKTILDWLIDDIDSTKKVNKYVIVTNDRYKNHFLNWKELKNIHIDIINNGTTKNDNRLGAVKDIQFAIDNIKVNDDLMIIAGDNVIDFSLKDFINYFERKQSSCVMRYYECSQHKLQKSGVITVDNQDLIIDMVEKPFLPKSNWAVPPFYIYKKDDVLLVKKAIDDGCETDAPGSFIAWLHKNKKVYAMQMKGKRYDIGDLDSYEKAKEEYNGIKK